MKKICGWIGAKIAPETLTKVADEMLSNNDFPGTQVGDSNVTSALYIKCHRPNAGSYQKSNKLHAAIIGEPYWIDNRLAKLANEQGHAAALTQAYHAHDIKLFEKLFGTFSLAILDMEKQSALIAIDRFGVQPLNFFNNQQSLIFASDNDSLLCHPSTSSDIDQQSLFNYIYFHVIPSPDTIYQKIQKLEPAQYLRLQKGKTQLAYYWLPTFQDRTTIPISELKAELKSQLENAVKHCEPDNTTGAFLSGGLDSSTVAGFLDKVRDGPVPTYTIGFDEAGYDEVSFARIAANHFGTQQHEYYVTPNDVMEAMPLIAQTYDEPFGNSSAIPTLFCAKLAAQHGTKVMLAGDGGDEIFAGNERYAKQKIFSVYDKLPALLRHLIVEPAFVSLPLSKITPPTRKIRSYIEQARLPMPNRMQSYNFLNRTDLNLVFEEDFLAAIDINYPVKLLSHTYEQIPHDSLVNRMLFLDWKFTLADNDLRKVNKMCELGGVEVRYPMMHDALVEFSTKVPSAIKLKGQDLRHFYKAALNDFLPTEIIHKTKHGFGLPFGEWLKQSPQLQDLIYSSLESLKTRHLIKQTFLDDLIKSHKNDHVSYHGTMVWVLATLEQWLQSRKLNI